MNKSRLTAHAGKPRRGKSYIKKLALSIFVTIFVLRIQSLVYNTRYVDAHSNSYNNSGKTKYYKTIGDLIPATLYGILQKNIWIITMTVSIPILKNSKKLMD